MNATVTIAHVTDVHLGPIAGFTPRHWNAKRALGYFNWVRKRQHAHLRGVLDRIVADMQAQRPDHIAVGGDLCNIGLPQEHVDALAWLQSLGSPQRVSVVPGNHDIYCRLRIGDPGVKHWARYMASDAAGATLARGPTAFPCARVVGNVALIGVNSAEPTPSGMAWGRVGYGQFARLAAALDRAREAGLFRLVTIHHPPLPGQASARRALKDAAQMRDVLASYGAELVIHGHNHINMLAWVEGPAGPIPVVGTPSGSLGRPYKEEPLGRYNLFRIGGSAGTWSIELIGRGLVEPDAPPIEIERRMLVPT